LSDYLQNYGKFKLQKYGHAVQTENLAFAGLPNLIGIEKLELTDSFVVVVLDADASTPLLNLTLGGPELDIYRVRSVENQAGCGNVD
jgi:hypothetical protein